MRRITLYRNPNCRRCGRIARVHGLLDWLGRIEHSTADPPTGPLPMGAIAVTDRATGRTYLGVDAVRRLFRQIPFYWPILPLLRIPAVARRVDRDTRGRCDGESCGVAADL